MRALRLAAAAAAVLAMATGLPVPASAARAVQLVTPYPAVRVSPGRSVTFDLAVVTPQRVRVDLQVVDAPPGWETTLRGGGYIVDSVFGNADTSADDKPPDVKLEVKIPADAKDGTYLMGLRAAGGGAGDQLPLQLIVARGIEGTVTVTAEFPSLRARSDATFTFRVHLNNGTPERTFFALDAQGPAGWNVVARPASEQAAATVTVDGGQTQQIEIAADPPADVASGSYPVKLTVTGAGKTVETELTAVVAGTTQVELTTPTNRLNVGGHAGRATDVPIVIRNRGSDALRGVVVRENAPNDWDVTYLPERLTTILPGAAGHLTVRITPPTTAVAGDYTVELTANAQGQTSTKSLRVSVEPRRTWAIIGLLLIFGALLSLREIFRRFGRR